MKRVKYIVLFLFVILFYGVSVLYVEFGVASRANNDIQLGFFSSHPEDYFQYVAMIRNGKEGGGILFHNQYIDHPKPDVLLQPIYPIFGIFSRLGNLDPFLTYLIAKSLFSILFVVMILVLIFYVFSHWHERFIATILSLTSTSIWFEIQCGPFRCLNDVATGARKQLNFFFRLLTLPPHHYLGIITMIVGFIMLSRMTYTPKWLGLFVVISIILALLQPYFALLYLLIVTAYLVVRSFQHRSTIVQNFFVLVFTFGSMAPIFLVAYMAAINPVVNSSNIFTFVPLQISLVNYFQGLGFIVVPFLFSIPLVISQKKNKLLFLCFLWTIIPFLGYITPLLNQVLGSYRILQIMQQIPAAICSTVVLSWLFVRFQKAGKVIVGAVLIVFLSYSLLFLRIQIPFIFSSGNGEFYLAQVIKDSIPYISALKSLSHPDDVIIAGESIAKIIPAVANLRVLNGHSGNSEHYDMDFLSIQRFYSGGYTETQAKDFLLNHHVAYITYGMGAPDYTMTKYYGASFLKEVYRKDGVSFVKVVL